MEINKYYTKIEVQILQKVIAERKSPKTSQFFLISRRNNIKETKQIK
jgi:hypothetical protein